jgi:hypothetical protein
LEFAAVFYDPIDGHTYMTHENIATWFKTGYAGRSEPDSGTFHFGALKLE